MAIIRLKASTKDYIWGGERLSQEYGMESEGQIVAEAWVLSCHPDGPSFIQGGPYANMTLPQYIEKFGVSVLGTNSTRFAEFPILVKLIDAKENLSIQVHPDNEYALQHEKQYGKTEMWYVVDCDKDAYLYYGVKKDIEKKELSQRIAENTLLEILNKVPIRKGDVFFIEAGTIHAICKNTMIAEIQQNSNVTYRVYDYGRVDKNGKARQLHVKQAMEVSDLTATGRGPNHIPHIAACEYFTVEKVSLDNRYMKSIQGVVDEKSFLHILILDGSGEVVVTEKTEIFHKGDSFFIPASTRDYEIRGSGEILLTYIK